MEAEENVDDESNETEKWNYESKCLPMRCITSVGFVNVSLDILNDEEPKYTRDEVLDSDTPVDSESWFPNLYCVFLFSTHLGH